MKVEKAKSNCISLEESVYERWRQFGTDSGLNTDSNIASFLLHRYETSTSPQMCASCHCRLPLFCLKCLKTPALNGPRSRRKKKTTVGSSRCAPNCKPQPDYSTDLGKTNLVPENTPGHPDTTSEPIRLEADTDSDITEELNWEPFAEEGVEERKHGVKREAGSPVGPDSVSFGAGFIVKGKRPQTKVGGKKILKSNICSDSFSGILAASSNYKDETKSQHSSELKTKTKTKPRGKPVICLEPGCGKSFAWSNLLKIHLRVHTGEKPYHCKEPGCGKSFTTSSALKVHTRMHSGEKPFQCDCCGQSYAQKVSLLEHMRMHSGEKMLHCPEPDCGKSFSRSSSLNAHRKIHSHEKPFQCDSCGHSFMLAGNLREHMRTHTGEKPFQCPDTNCGKSFVHLSTLKNHFRTHSGEKPFQCQEPGCGRSFARSSTLKIHTYTHTGHKPFTCPSPGCGRSFSQASNLKGHLKMHAGQMPLPCIEPMQDFSFERYHKAQTKVLSVSTLSCPEVNCSKSFTRSSDLNRHRKIHGGERSFQCPEPGCGVSCNEAGNLKVHLRTHSGERPFHCSEPGCGKLFAL